MKPSEKQKSELGVTKTECLGKTQSTKRWIVLLPLLGIFDKVSSNLCIKIYHFSPLMGVIFVREKIKNPRNPRLAVILPVHNEENTIKGVIDAISSFNLFDEIIAVTDGTTDGSLEILRSCAQKKRIIWLNYKRNRGKGFALSKGVQKSTADIVVFFDTDQTDIKREHLEKMVNPLIASEADYVIGDHGKDAKLDLFRDVCGNRCYFRKDLLPFLKVMQVKRRGIELFLNYELSQKGKKGVFVALSGLVHHLKYVRRTPGETLLDYLREGHELAVEYARQGKLSGKERTEFIRSWMVRFLGTYARYFKLPAKKTRTIVSEFLNDLRGRRKG